MKEIFSYVKTSGFVIIQLEDTARYASLLLAPAAGVVFLLEKEATLGEGETLRQERRREGGCEESLFFPPHRGGAGLEGKKPYFPAQGLGSWKEKEVYLCELNSCIRETLNLSPCAGSSPDPLKPKKM